jgi:methionyl aminopeptidase
MKFQYKNGKYPVGEIQEYKNDKSKRISSEELREKEKLFEDQIQNLRKAAECHRQVRKFAQTYIRPGMRLIDICDKLEEMNRYLIQANGIKAGIAFPTGCSLNHCAAHYTPNTGDYTVLDKDDVCKVTWGENEKKFSKKIKLLNII